MQFSQRYEQSAWVRAIVVIGAIIGLFAFILGLDKVLIAIADDDKHDPVVRVDKVVKVKRIDPHSWILMAMLNPTDGLKAWIIKEDNRKVGIIIPDGSLIDWNEYRKLKRSDVSTGVEIEIQIDETLETRKDGTQFYRLEISFSPDVYFDSNFPALVIINGKYVKDDPNYKLWLFDDDGEAIDGVQHTPNAVLTFGRITVYPDVTRVYKMDRWSVYSYDEYDIVP